MSTHKFEVGERFRDSTGVFEIIEQRPPNMPFDYVVSYENSDGSIGKQASDIEVAEQL
jgi:hypothetical protein